MPRPLFAAMIAAATLTSAMTASQPAHAYWRRSYGPGIVGGALLGLGVGALLAAPYVAPPPVYYAPPAYYPPPPPAYYPPPYGYPQPYYRPYYRPY